MTILAKVNGKDPGRDRLLAEAAGRRFPAPVSLTNTSSAPVKVELRIRPGSGARVTIQQDRWTIDPGATVETTLQAQTPSLAGDDTVLEVVVEGVVESEFRFTAVSLLRESVFHNLVPKPPDS